MKTLAIEYLRECFDYDPTTGELRWKKRPRHHFKSDKGWKSSHTQVGGKLVASRQTDEYPYPYVMIDKTPYLVHRLCFAIYHGFWPKEVDHRDGDTRNNRVGNLRSATRPQNGRNTGVRTTNLSGLKGISRRPEKNLERPWYGRVRVDGRSIRTAYYSTAEEAYEAYIDLAKEHYGPFARSLR